MIVIKTLADQIVLNNCYYSTDERVVTIIEFECEDDTMYGLVYHGKRNGYQSGTACRNPRIYWQAKLDRRV